MPTGRVIPISRRGREIPHTAASLFCRRCSPDAARTPRADRRGAPKGKRLMATRAGATRKCRWVKPASLGPVHQLVRWSGGELPHRIAAAPPAMDDRRVARRSSSMAAAIVAFAMDRDELGGVSEHEAGESDDVEAGERGGQALVVLDRAPAAAGPSERPVDGLIANDKFRLPRTGQPRLGSPRARRGLRAAAAPHLPGEVARRGGGHAAATRLAHPANRRADANRPATLGPGLPAPPAGGDEPTGAGGASCA